jgi:hypothetical protein
MTLYEKYQEVIKDLAYKPNVSFHLQLSSDGDSFRLIIRSKVTCVNENKLISVCYKVDMVDELETKQDVKSIIKIIKECIEFNEDHERDEWFKYKGKCITDPHPELKKRGT